MTKRLTALAALAALLVAAPAYAAAPAERIPFSTTVPLASGVYYFRFSLWDASGVTARGSLVWSEEKRLAVRGVPAGAGYRAPLRHLLGSVNLFASSATPPYPPVDFSRQLWVEVAYRSVPTRPWRALKKRAALALAPYALWSGRAAAAGDADTVDGLHADEMARQAHTHDAADIASGTVAEGRIDAALARDQELDSHAGRTDNPHQVTAAQAGAAAAEHTHGAGDIAAGTFPFASLPTGTGADQVAIGSHAHDGAYHARAHVDALEARIAALESAKAALESRVAALESATAPLAAILEHLSHAEFGGLHTILVSGANLQVVDGSGGTDGATNGMGNLIVGYNASRVTAGGADQRTGSHNLIVGDQNNYTSYGGFVAGQQNVIANTYATVSGGQANTASGAHSSVAGGGVNTASGPNAWVGGGSGNVASGPFASVSGGGSNTASNVNAAVSGGDNNIASGSSASVSGGSSNFAIGAGSSVGGGFANAATGEKAVVGGGYNRTADGEYDWRAGSLFADQ